MALIDWKPRALANLARHDAWRKRNGWEPMAREIQDAVENYFNPPDLDEPPHFLPGKQARLDGEPVDLRMVLIPVRSKDFKVFFRYGQGVFEIRRVLHPKQK